jgi:hypothetical protein
MPNHRQIVRYKKISNAELLLKIPKQIYNLRLDRDVQRADWLITYDQLGFDRQGTRNPNPLPLSAAEFVRVTAGVGTIKSNLLEQALHPLPAIGIVGRETMNLQCLTNDLLDSASRIQRTIRVLKDHLKLATSLAKSRAPKPTQVFPLEENLAGRGFHEAYDRATERRFAAAAFAHQPHRFARPNSETHTIHGAHEFPWSTERPRDDRKMNFEVSDFQERRFHIPGPQQLAATGFHNGQRTTR